MWTEAHQLRAEGRREELAEVVLRILTLRGLRVDEQSRKRILRCRSKATLNLWFERALRARSISKVLEP